MARLKALAALCIIVPFQDFGGVASSANIREIMKNIFAFAYSRHNYFEEVDHDIARKHLRLTEEGRVVNLMKCNSNKGLDESVIVTVNRLVNMDEDEISMEVVESHEYRPCIGVTGPEGEYGALIGCNDSNSSYKSRYGDQGVGMDMNRYLRNKGEEDVSLHPSNAIKKGDVIRMVVKNHTLTYYHNNERIGPFKIFNPITLLKNRDYKFAVELYGTASVRILI